MAVEVKVPILGESVTEATVAKWFKKIGESVQVDEMLVELETDKVTVEVNSPATGALSEILVSEGMDVEVGALLGRIDDSLDNKKSIEFTEGQEKSKDEKLQEVRSIPSSEIMAEVGNEVEVASSELGIEDRPLSPAVRKLIDDNNIDRSLINGTGKDGRITKADVHSLLNGDSDSKIVANNSSSSKKALNKETQESRVRPDHPLEERIRISKLRRIISARLKDAQNTAAMLTTWNEVDMSAAIKLRSTYKEAFEKKHGVRLGFMSYFVRAVCIALKEWPTVNAEVWGDELIFKNYYNIGVAVGTPQGLVVPVLKDADKMGFSKIESTISDFGQRARDGRLSMSEMAGGTFTISNGGVYGSLNSMPILNVPQSGILGMHKIQKRPIAVGEEVVVRAMMYLALSYDHRVVDGREAVSFLVRIKECIEDPQRIMLDV